MPTLGCYSAVRQTGCSSLGTCCRDKTGVLLEAPGTTHLLHCDEAKPVCSTRPPLQQEHTMMASARLCWRVRWSKAVLYLTLACTTLEMACLMTSSLLLFWATAVVNGTGQTGQSVQLAGESGAGVSSQCPHSPCCPASASRSTANRMVSGQHPAAVIVRLYSLGTDLAEVISTQDPAGWAHTHTLKPIHSALMSSG